MRKRCTVCRRKRPVGPNGDFHSNGKGAGGETVYRAACKGCENEVRRSIDTERAAGRITGRGERSEPAAELDPPLVERAERMPRLEHAERAPRTRAVDPETDALIEDAEERSALRTAREERDSLIKRLLLAEKRQDVLDSLAAAPTVRVSRPPSAKSGSGRREGTAVLLCSDWHVEETVEAEKVNGMNEYDLGIAERRIEKLTDGFLWLLEMHRSKFDISTAVVWLGGDLMSGYIHEELEESNTLSPIETILWLQERVARMLLTILERSQLTHLIVPCTSGNHGRTTRKKRISTESENSYEYLLYQVLARHFAKDPRITFIAPKGPLVYLNVYDFVLRFAHGDQVGYGGGVGGISIGLNKKLASWDVGKKADVTCIGHFHQVLNGPNYVTNGSLVGFSPFAVHIGAKYEPPQQAFFVMDAERGKTSFYPLWVDDKVSTK